jgi:cysteine desulfuration protein SufE
VAIALMIYSDKSAREILAIDAAPILRELGLHDHLTPQRSNGFAAMIGRIKSDARAALQHLPAEGIAGR